MWGIFVRQRVVQKQAKKYLTWVAVLLIFLDDGALGKIFYLLAGGCNTLCVVSLLSADDLCADVSVINCFVVGETR